MVNAQQWINEKFPNETEKVKVKTLAIVSYTYNKYYNNWDDHTKWIPAGEERNQFFFRTEDGRSIVVDKIEYDFYLSSLPGIRKFAPDRPWETIDEQAGFYEWIGGSLINGSLEIKNFPNLEKLVIIEQGITSLKVSETPKLESLTCAYGFNQELQELELNCPSLKALQINHNHYLQKVNFGSLPQLTNFYFEATGFYGPSKTILNKLVQVEKETSLRLRKMVDEQRITIQNLQTELEREKNKNKFLSEKLETKIELDRNQT